MFLKVKLKNLSMPTMQNILQSGWFCKLIASCWSPLLPYCFCRIVFSIKSFFKDTVCIYKKNLLTFIVLLLAY